MKFKIHLIICTLSLSLSACLNDEPCDSVSPPVYAFGFSVIDSSTGLSLIGEDRLYKPDTIRILNPNLFAIHSSVDTLVGYAYTRVPSGQATIFYLNYTEADTIVVEYSTYQGECFPIANFQSFTYNDSLIDPQTGVVYK